MFARTIPLVALVYGAAILAPAVAADGEHGAPLRPNVVLILADDLGYETIGANGGQSYKTPVLDRMAAEGARFTHCYVPPLCTPTRAALMTGLSNVRNYVDFGMLDRSARTFGNIFQQAGYRTCIAGKWQLGADRDLPAHFGFAEHCLWQHTRRPGRYANPGLEIDGVERDFTGGEYGPDIVNDYAIDFIRRRRNEPFFLYYPMMLTHAPFQPTPDSADWDPAAIGEEVHQDVAHFADMVAAMDKLIGRLLAVLNELSLRERTLVVFLGDNGTGRAVTSRINGQAVQGGKGRTQASGMHVPLIASWPSVIPAGVVCPDLVDATDFLPTLCEASGVPLPDDVTLDGQSFFPQLQGQAGQPREWIYCWYSPRGEPPLEFTFTSRHKLYRDGRFFDLTGDPQEQRPLAVAEQTGKASRAATALQAALDQYRGARPAELDRKREEIQSARERPGNRRGGSRDARQGRSRERRAQERSLGQGAARGR